MQLSLEVWRLSSKSQQQKNDNIQGHRWKSHQLKISDLFIAVVGIVIAGIKHYVKHIYYTGIIALARYHNTPPNIIKCDICIGVWW